MKPTNQQVSETVERLARGQFEAAIDWPICFELVRSKNLLRKLPAKDFAPSPYGGSDWDEDDFTEIAGEWIIFIRGAPASRLTAQGRSAAHVAASVKRSIYHFVLDQRRPTPQRDLWAALKEVLPEYSSLISGEPSDAPPPPGTFFPWQQKRVRSARRRAVTAPEVRAALAIVRQQQPEGWSRKGLFNYLAEWSGVAHAGEKSRDTMDSFPGPIIETPVEQEDSSLLGRTTAQLLLRQLDEGERAILRGFIIPNELGKIGLETAARALGLSKSTLHDRAGRLKRKLSSKEFCGLLPMDAEERQTFLAEILGDDAGKTAGDESIT